MTNDNHVFFLSAKGDRPDFRIIQDFIWGENHKIDSDGDSYNPASRKWTELYIRSREIENEYVDISPLQIDPLILRIESSNDQLAIQVTMYLAEETQGTIFLDKEMTQNTTLDDLAKRTILADYQARRERTKNSIWIHSTLDNPYPNIVK